MGLDVTVEAGGETARISAVVVDEGVGRHRPGTGHLNLVAQALEDPDTRGVRRRTDAERCAARRATVAGRRCTRVLSFRSGCGLRGGGRRQRVRISACGTTG